jgi:hypothetical protein
MEQARMTNGVTRIAVDPRKEAAEWQLEARYVAMEQGVPIWLNTGRERITQKRGKSATLLKRDANEAAKRYRGSRRYQIPIYLLSHLGNRR